MPIGRIQSSGANEAQSIELNELQTQSPVKPTSGDALGLVPSDPTRPNLDPQGRQNSSVQETSFSNTPLKGNVGEALKKEARLLAGNLVEIKEYSDHTAFKHFDNLFTGNKAGFTQIESLGKVISGSEQLDLKQTIALSEEAVGTVGLISKKSWEVGRGIASGISSAKKVESIKDSVSSLSLNSVALTSASGVNTAFAGIAVIKSSAELVRDLSLDVLAHKERQTAQALLKNYDPASGKFSDPATGKPVSEEENQKLTAQLKELIGKKGSDRSRSVGQVVGDRLSTVRDVALSGGSVANTALSLAGAAAKVTPGLSQAFSAVSAAKTTWQAATNIVALNNIQHAAKEAKGDKLLEAIAAHVSQERVYNSRKHLINATANFAAVGLGVAALAAGPGAPAALAVASIASSAVTTAIGLGTTAFELGHAYQLSQRRKEGSAEALELFKEAVGNEALSEAHKNEAFKALADPKNIGLAERALIDRLQNGSPEEVKTAVQFLENFGLSKGTISKLKLASTDKALSALQSALYNDKVAFKSAGLKQSFSTLGKITGVSQFASFVKEKWAVFQAWKGNNYRTPFQSWVTNSVVSNSSGGDKVVRNRGTKDLIKGLDKQIHHSKAGKVSENFAKLRDKYLKVPKPKIDFIQREPVKFGADISLDESTWNPKTGTYDDF